MKVVLLASRRMVLGFLLGGIHAAYTCENMEESKKIFHECLEKPEIGIILVSRSVADMIPDSIHTARTSPRMVPIVSVIPDTVKKPSVDMCPM